jgi:hypothetical protein
MPHSILWDIYPAVEKAIRLGEVEATDEANAIVKAAKEFKQDPAMLIVVRRSLTSFCRERQDIAVESGLLAFFGCQCCLRL